MDTTMNMTTFIRCTVLGFAALTANLPATALALDLLGAYEKALKFDPTRLGAEEAVLAGREKAVQGDALLKPQVFHCTKT